MERSLSVTSIKDLGPFYHEHIELINNNILTYKQLLQYDRDTLTSLVGELSVRIIEKDLEEDGLCLGMSNISMDLYDECPYLRDFNRAIMKILELDRSLELDRTSLLNLIYMALTSGDDFQKQIDLDAKKLQKIELFLENYGLHIGMTSDELKIAFEAIQKFKEKMTEEFYNSVYLNTDIFEKELIYNIYLEDAGIFNLMDLALTSKNYLQMIINLAYERKSYLEDGVLEEEIEVSLKNHGLHIGMTLDELKTAFESEQKEIDKKEEERQLKEQIIKECELSYTSGSRDLLEQYPHSLYFRNSRKFMENELSTRAKNCLNRAHILNMIDLALEPEDELRRIRNLGAGTYQEIKIFLENHGLHVGMTLDELKKVLEVEQKESEKIFGDDEESINEEIISGKEEKLTTLQNLLKTKQQLLDKDIMFDEQIAQVIEELNEKTEENTNGSSR